jgi:hypothetical protein
MNLPYPSNRRPTLLGRLAEFFRSHPGQWIDGRELADISGAYAWRSRVSDLRRGPFLFTILNRQRRVRRSDGSSYVVSEYRYEPLTRRADEAR